MNNKEIFKNLKYNNFFINLTSLEEIKEWINFAQKNIDSNIVDGATKNGFPPERVFDLGYKYSFIDNSKQIHFNNSPWSLTVNFKDIKHLKGKRLFKVLMGQSFTVKKEPKWKSIWKDK